MEKWWSGTGGVREVLVRGAERDGWEWRGIDEVGKFGLGMGRGCRFGEVVERIRWVWINLCLG